MKTGEDIQNVTALLMRHYNAVAQAFMPPAHDYGALYDQDKRTEEILRQSWCCGFERAMRLRPDAWERIVESADKDSAASVSMMLALFNIAEGQSDLSNASIKALTVQAPDIIQNLVLSLNAWTKSGTTAAPVLAGTAANRTEPPLRGAKAAETPPAPVAQAASTNTAAVPTSLR